MSEKIEHDYSGPQLAALLRSRTSRPWISLRLAPEVESEILRVPSGACVALTAATGEGKSTLALQLAWLHALTAGPAIYVSLELDADEIAARLVAQRCRVGWEDALAGCVESTRADEALQLPRFRVLTRSSANLTQLAARVGALRTEYPGQPIVVAVDYVQIMPGKDGLDGDPRTRVASVVEQVRTATKELDVATIMISQCSREVAEQLHTGNRTGDRTTAAGAESAQIERAAHATLAIGGRKADDADGFAPMTLSIGKNRMGPGNRVVPLRFNGRTGEFRVAGPATSAKAVATGSKRASDGDRVVAFVRQAGVSFKNPTAIYTACKGGQYKGSKQPTLAAVTAELQPGGRLEWRGEGTERAIFARPE